jgi:hypothetical protein
MEDLLRRTKPLYSFQTTTGKEEPLKGEAVIKGTSQDIKRP